MAEEVFKKEYPPEISPLRSPDFLSSSVALINFMRFRLRETAPAVLAIIAK
jgi:hypothetical protein